MTAEEPSVPPAAPQEGALASEPAETAPETAAETTPTVPEANLSYEAEMAERAAEVRERLREHAEQTPSASEAFSLPEADENGPDAAALGGVIPAVAIIAPKPSLKERIISAFGGIGAGRGAAIGVGAAAVTFSVAAGAGFLGSSGVAASWGSYGALGKSALNAIAVVGKVLGVAELVLGFPFIVGWILQRINKFVGGASVGGGGGGTKASGGGH